jgi:hypothetical protein
MLSAIPTGHGDGNLPLCTDMQLDSDPPHAGLLHDVPHPFRRPPDWVRFVVYAFPIPLGSRPSSMLNLLAVTP